MNLQVVPPNSHGWAGRLTCCKCTFMFYTNEPRVPVLADLDGTPFQAYYCVACAVKTGAPLPEMPPLNLKEPA